MSAAASFINLLQLWLWDALEANPHGGGLRNPEGPAKIDTTVPSAYSTGLTLERSSFGWEIVQIEVKAVASVNRPRPPEGTLLLPSSTAAYLQGRDTRKVTSLGSRFTINRSPVR